MLDLDDYSALAYLSRSLGCARARALSIGFSLFLCSSLGDRDHEGLPRRIAIRLLRSYPRYNRVEAILLFCVEIAGKSVEWRRERERDVLIKRRRSTHAVVHMSYIKRVLIYRFLKAVVRNESFNKAPQIWRSHSARMRAFGIIISQRETALCTRGFPLITALTS